MAEQSSVESLKRPTSFRRYWNLIRNVSNWHLYFLNKLGTDTAKTIRYRDRRNAVQLDIPHPLRGIFKEIYLNDIYDMETLARGLPPDPIVIDVGANIGIFSLRLSALRPDSTIFAYEPHPRNVDLLRKNVEMNPRLNVHVFSCAVSGRPASDRKLFLDPEKPYTPTASLEEGFSASNRKSVSVDTTSLSEIVEKNALERIHLLKLDCEGSEFDILFNTPPDIMARVDAITMEVHESGERTLESMRNTLHSMGFQLREHSISEGVYLVYASR